MRLMSFSGHGRRSGSGELWPYIAVLLLVLVLFLVPVLLTVHSGPSCAVSTGSQCPQPAVRRLTPSPGPSVGSSAGNRNGQPKIGSGR